MYTDGGDYLCVSDAISRLGLMSMELHDSLLKLKKSSRSGVLILLANKLVHPWIVFLNAFLYGLVQFATFRIDYAETQGWYFALKSPPTRNLCPSELMKTL
jgi:hypothetical protein